MAQLGRLQSKRDEIEAAGGALVGISVDLPSDSRQLLQELDQQGHPLSFPLACDPRRAVVKAMGVYDADHDIALPSVLILDADGQVAWKYVGETILDRPEEQALIDALGELSQGVAPVDSGS